jgi:hypothetical protein
MEPRERRRSLRPRVLLGGKLVYGGSHFSVDCTIRDMTDSGARARLGANNYIENEVWLINLHGGVAYHSVVAWRRPPELGLCFLREIDLKQPVAGEHHHLRRLWLDCRGG